MSKKFPESKGRSPFSVSAEPSPGPPGVSLLQPSKLLAAIVQSSDDAIISKTIEGYITSWNRGAQQIFGYTAEEAIGRHITLIIPPDRHQEEADILARLRSGEHIDHFETVRMAKDGTLRDVSLTISPITDASGRIVGASTIARDITARKRFEKERAERVRQQQALFRMAEQLLRAESFEDIYAAGLDAIFGAILCDRASILLFDDSGVMRFVASRGLSESYRQATEGHSPWARGTADAAPICVNDVRATPFQEPLQSTICSEGIAALAFVPLVSSASLIGKFMVYFDQPHVFTEDELDLSLTISRQLASGVDRKRSEEALARSREQYQQLAQSLDAEVQARTRELEERNADVVRQSEQLRELSWRVMQVQDEERRRLARELHDSAGQTLTVIGMNLGRLMHRAEQGEFIRASDLRESSELVHQLSREIRTTSYLLHPPLLEESGLASALRWYVAGLMDRGLLEINLTIPENFGRLSSEMELVLFRIVQEALTNVHRHSGSKTAEIRICRDSNRVALEIQDHGRGIPAEKLSHVQASGTGVGLRGMRERVRQLHGLLVIDSGPAGTTIRVNLPISSDALKHLEAAGD
ncbi:MAG TPA: PAS domain S-box protein [Candidatus Acidoferrum sp.]|jgi:PAS domain S-box-containing protein|nr:PAS domain S-box protein [Candidatus Acidoferrum sp.]